VADTIKCACSHCGAKYRLPIEAQGRTARCKRCGDTFEVPRQESAFEDTILSWLTPPEEEEAHVAKPRVISMPREPADPDAAKRMRGPIRLKDEADSDAKQPRAAKAK
jgi:tRNA(Ile2) C34 agmatinyltransferase TiaS